MMQSILDREKQLTENTRKRLTLSTIKDNLSHISVYER